MHRQPGGGLAVRYRATVTWRSGPATEVLCASTEPPPPGARLVGGVAVWRLPHDPWLPGLATVWPRRARLRAYRPGRRAVVELAGAFAKVVRPGRQAELAHRHALLSAGGVPVPGVLEVDDRGVVVLEALPGDLLRTRLVRGAPVPAGRELLAALDRLPASLLGLPRRPSWSDGASRYAEDVAAVLPSEAARAHELAAAVTGGLTGLPADAPVHGDLHGRQLLVGDDGRLTGVLDVDRAGPGRRADDLGCLLAHALLVPGADAVVAQWRSAYDATVDPRELRLRTAGVLLSLATGPYRVQAPAWQAETAARLALAEAALAAAR